MKRLSNQPAGFRDLYWCWLLNEPSILKYEGEKRICRNCDGDPANDPNHTFIGHIRKPLWSKEWNANGVNVVDMPEKDES